MNNSRSGEALWSEGGDLSEALLLLLLDGPSRVILVVDESRRVLFVSSGLAALLHRTPAECHGLALAELSPQLEAACAVPIERLFAGGEAQDEVELSIAGAGGGSETHWRAALRALPRENAGVLAGISLTNISELRAARDELHERTVTLETLNRIGRLLTAELDIEKLVQTVTDAATRISGAQFGAFFYNVVDERGERYTLYTLSGAPRAAFDKFPVPRNTEVFGPTFRGEGPICLSNVREDPRYGRMAPYYGMPEGHLPVTSYLAVPVTSRSGEVLGALFFGHEEEGVFTEREVQLVTGIAAQTAVAMDNARLFQSLQQKTALAEEARREAEAANRAKDEFLAVVSHELRTPLTAMRGWLHLVRHGKLDEKAREQALDALERSARTQTQLIDDLLDVSRIILGKMHLNSDVVDLAILIREAVDIVRPAADAREIRISVRCDDGARRVQGDTERLRQVVWNLLSNAVKFTAPGGLIEVRLSQDEEYACIVVSDNGIGIAPDFLPHVFDRFRQADSTSTRTHNGLGLGLSIVRHIVEMHGGSVAVQSEGHGTGTAFSVRLPLAPQLQGASPSTAQRDSAAPLSTEALRGLRLLVVEDEEDSRLLLEITLTRYGGSVRSARLASEGYDIAASWKPDVLISDIGMPGEDGCSLIRKIRDLPPEEGGSLPAIALTAYARAEDRVRILAAGFNTHIPKPIDINELVAAIGILTKR